VRELGKGKNSTTIQTNYPFAISLPERGGGKGLLVPEGGEGDKHRKNELVSLHGKRRKSFTLTGGKVKSVFRDVLRGSGASWWEKRVKKKGKLHLSQKKKRRKRGSFREGAKRRHQKKLRPSLTTR